MAHRVYFGEEDGISKLSDSIVSVIGGGDIGYEEGSRQQAQFNGISSIATYIVRDSLFVCDTGNDVIREVVERNDVGTSSMFLAMPCQVISFDKSYNFLYVGSGSVVYRVTIEDKSAVLYVGSSQGMYVHDNYLIAIVFILFNVYQVQ